MGRIDPQQKNLIARAGAISLLVLMALSLLSTPAAYAAQTAPAPTIPAGAPVTVRFTETTINKTAPKEAIPEIDLRLGAGTYPGCLDAFDEPTIDFYTDALTLTDIAFIASCGWKADETVKITLMDPQGKLTSSEVKAVPARQKKGVYEADIFYQPGVDAPEGKYRFTLQGSSGAAAIKAKITYTKAKTARLYVLPEEPFAPKFGAYGGQQRLRLNGFLPNEPVRLLAYRVEGTLNRFYGWQDFTADRKGQLIIETDLPEISKAAAGKDAGSKDTPSKDAASQAAGEMNYFAYGLETHFIPLERFREDTYSKTRQFDLDLYCPGAQAPRLNAPQQIRLAAGFTSLDIHQQPGYGSRITGQVPADTPIRTFGYPKCIDHAYWWQVSVSKPILFGWVAESYLGKYWIEAIK